MLLHWFLDQVCLCSRFLRLSFPSPEVLYFSWIFKASCFWTLISPVQNLGVGVPEVELEFLPPQGKDPYFWDSSQCGSPQLGCGFILGEILSPPLLPVLMLSSYLLLWRLCFQVPFQESYPICSCRFVLSFRGGAFRTFLSCHLEPSSLSYLTFLIVNSITFLFYLF